MYMYRCASVRSECVSRSLSVEQKQATSCDAMSCIACPRNDQGRKTSTGVAAGNANGAEETPGSSRRRLLHMRRGLERDTAAQFSQPACRLWFTDTDRVLKG